MIVVHGCDISLNHGAIVELSGELNKKPKMTGFWYYTDIAGSATRSAEHGARLTLLKSPERQRIQMDRLAWVDRWMGGRFERKPNFVGVEDYAIRVEQGAHYIGEVGALARMQLWHRGIAFRLHDPISVKMFITHDGTAQKDLVEEKVKERWGEDFGGYNGPPVATGRHKGKQNRRTSEDLADAYGIARLVWIEAKLRAGFLTLDKLEHPKEIQVFQRVTKTYPTNLLGREWILNPFPRSGCDISECALAKLKLPDALTKKIKRIAFRRS